MPESEPKPRALEAVTPGSPQGWKAVLRNGKQVVVHEIPAASAAAAAAVPRLQRLSEQPHPSLSPILAWGTEDGGVWVAVEPNEGAPLGTVLSRGRFTPHAASALGLSVLSGVAALHEAGVAMGGFDASTVRITGNGEVRIAGHPVAAVRGAPSQGDLRADVRSCGMAICAAFGVDPSGAPAPSELSPGLVVTIRSMASGAMGPAVDRAMGALREMAGPLLAPDRQMAAQSELALRAGGREMPSITPFIPGAEPAAPAPAPAPAAPQPEESRPSRSVSYDAPPRPVDTYSPVPRPVESYSPPSAYQTAGSLPVEPPAPAPAEPETPAIATPPTPPLAPAPEPAAPTGAATWETAPAPAPAPPPEPAQPAPWEEAAPPASQPAYASNPPAPAPVEPPAEAPVETAPAPFVNDWPEPGVPLEPAAPAAAAAVEPAAPAPTVPSARPTGEWSPVATGSWTPGPSHHVSSSEWTGEATPAPQPVPEELKEPKEPARPQPAAVKEQTVPSYMPAEQAPSYVPPVPRAAAPAPTKKTAAARRPSIELPSERPRWLIPAAIAVVVLLLLGGTGVYLASRGTSATTTAHNSPHPTSSPKASPSPTNVLQNVPVYAPSNAAPIKMAQFCTPATPCVAPGIPNATDTNCQLGARCSIDVGIFYSPSYGGPVSYVLKFFDRCTGTTTDLPGRSSTAGNAQFPKFSVSEVSTNVTLPTGAKSAALVAVTQQPSVVASAPLLLGATSC